MLEKESLSWVTGHNEDYRMKRQPMSTSEWRVERTTLLFFTKEEWLKKIKNTISISVILQHKGFSWSLVAGLQKESADCVQIDPEWETEEPGGNFQELWIPAD